MKKLLIFLVPFFLLSCSESKRPYIEIDGIKVVTIDNCEYIRSRAYGIDYYSFTHKGNCKFCTERRKKEYAEVVDSLFMMQE